MGEFVVVVGDDCGKTCAISVVVGGPTWRDNAANSSNPVNIVDIGGFVPTAPMVVAFCRRAVAERKWDDDMGAVSDVVKGRVLSKLLGWLVKMEGGWKKGGGENWWFSVLMCMRGLELGLGF